MDDSVAPSTFRTLNDAAFAYGLAMYHHGVAVGSDESTVGDAMRAGHRAQVAWTDYLQALWRATHGDMPMPYFGPTEEGRSTP